MTSFSKPKQVEFFGPLSWVNLLDWLATLCLGAILVLTTLRLGGVRPDTQADLLPLFGLALALHGLWVLAQGKVVCRLSAVPFLFVPFSIWACLSVLYFSPASWRGSYELIYLAGALIFLWVALNNLRSRAHLWVLLLCALAPAATAVFRAYHQFFQSKAALADPWVSYPLDLHADYAGRATGVFADPNSFAAYVLVLLPCLWIAAIIPRLPMVLRVFCFYAGLILVVSITFAQSYWAVFMVALLMVLVPFFCFERMKRRLLVSGGGLFAVLAVFVGMYFASPLVAGGFAQALSEGGEGVRLVLWKDALALWGQQPILGLGAGAYSWAVEHTNVSMLPFVPATPHNDFLLILTQYGLVGALLLFGPLGFILYRAYRRCRQEPFARRVRDSKTLVKVSGYRFFLSIGVCGLVAFGMAAFFSFPGYVPALLLLGLVLLVICAKYAFDRTLALPRGPMTGALYFLTTVVVGFLFVVYAGGRLESQALELQASQELEHLVAAQIPISGDRDLLDGVVHRYTDAVLADPENADAWIGLSAAICQTHYRNPAVFERTGARAVQAAEQAYRICPEYWRASAQLGVAHALRGDLESAERALLRAVEMAPNNSNANYYYAAFLSKTGKSPDRALRHVKRALEINPDSAVARQLQSRLLVY